MRVGAAVLCSLIGVGCSASPLEVRSAPHAALVAPHQIAEGDTGKPASSSAASPPESPPQAGDLPDPAPLSERTQYEFTLHYLAGDIEIESVRKLVLERPRPTPRRMGRFAFELWIGKELVDRVRFDFPLLAAEPAPSDKQAGVPGLAARADVRHVVAVPGSDRATRAHLVDRATGELIVVPWPPESSASALAGPAEAPK